MHGRFIEAAGAAAGIDEPLQMTVGLTDGEALYAARYASGPVVNTLFVSEDVESVRRLYPERERLSHLSDDARIVLSEPVIDLPGAWREVAPGTAITVHKEMTEHSFRPCLPT